MPSRGSRRRARLPEDGPAPDEPGSVRVFTDDICALCDRPIPRGARASRHHLTPKLKGGAKLPTVKLHQICHSAIHARWSEAELARRLSDPESLKAEPELARFLEWVRTKPNNFHAATRMTAKRRAERPRR